MASCISILIAFISDKTRLRGAYLAGFTILGMVGFILLRVSDEASVRYVAVFFAAVGAFPGGPGFLSWGLNSESSNLPARARN